MPTTMNPRQPLHQPPSGAEPWLTERQILVLLILHVPLAFALQRIPYLSTLHALGLALMGLAFVARDRAPDRVVAVITYVCGSEVLWRGTHTLVFWEWGKYASVGLALLAVVRFGSRSRFSETSGLVYAGLMLPSLLVLPYFNRSEVAFNVSGPVALGLLVYLFSRLSLSPLAVRGALVAMLAPLVSLGALSAFSAFTIEDFSEVAIGGKATTAGIGPNQVSAALGLGVVVTFLLLPMLRRRSSQGLLAVLGLWLLAQTMLSLSRGGFWTALGAMAAASLFLLRERRLRGLALGAALVLVPTFQYLIFPAIDSLSGGLVGARFADDRLTGRDKIVEADLIAFREHPLLGVGPGQSKYSHDITFKVSSAHTEYSRLLAEHGTFGILAMMLLVWMGFNRLRQPRHPLEKAVALAFCVWTALYMGHSAMRLVAPATLFALAGVRWILPGDQPLTAPLRRRRRTVPAGGLQPRPT